MTDDIKRIHWKKGDLKISGDEGPRDVKVWLLVEEKDFQDEVTLTKAMAPVMDWFVGPVQDDGKGGHGGPMIDTHTNAVIGHWKTWGIAREPDTKELGMWMRGVVHRGPEAHNLEFPAADLVWNDAKQNLVVGASWGGNKREGYIEFNTKTGEVSGNTITKVLPYEVSLVRSSVRGPNGMPAIPAVPHAKLIELSSTVKSTNAGMYGDKSQQLDALAPDSWMANCICNTSKFLGEQGSKEFCTLLYQQSGEKLKETLGTSWSTKEVFKLDEADKKYMEDRFTLLDNAVKALTTKEAPAPTIPEEVRKTMTMLEEGMKALKASSEATIKELADLKAQKAKKEEEMDKPDPRDEEEEQKKAKKVADDTAAKALADANAKAEAAVKEADAAKKALSALASSHESKLPEGNASAGNKTLDLQAYLKASPTDRARML